LRVLGKGNKYRTVSLGVTAVKGLAGYLRARRGGPQEPLFLNQKGRELTASGLYQLMERLAVVAGVPNPGGHALRRSLAGKARRGGRQRRWLFNQTGRALSASWLYQLMEWLSVVARVPCPGVRALRRSLAGNMLRAGASVFSVRTLMGYSDLTTSRKYVRIAE